MEATAKPVRFEVRIPKSFDEKLQRRADEGDRSKNAQIIRALRYYLDHAKEDE